MLYIVPTPIGNLEDMTFRAVKVLEAVDLILAEDTRTSGKLMKHYQISTPMQSNHMHNEHRNLERLVEMLKNETDIALISDAGTPGISDPGFLLVRAAVEADIKVQTLPGATAFVPALVNSGLPCDRFCFEGFLPHKKGRQTKMKMLLEESRTIVLYESPFRLLKTLTQFKELMGGERRASVSREISKKFEETVRGNLAELVEHFQKSKIKGEIVLIIQGNV